MTDTGGLYVLFVRLDEERPLAIEVGALGRITFEPGLYGYVGSARGSGGFARIDRHQSIATGDQRTRHWHIDYLLADERARLVDTWRLPGRADECALANTIPGRPVSGFGASDCDCPSHLFSLPDRSTVRAAIERFDREG